MTANEDFLNNNINDNHNNQVASLFEDNNIETLHENKMHKQKENCNYLGFPIQNPSNEEIKIKYPNEITGFNKQSTHKDQKEEKVSTFISSISTSKNSKKSSRWTKEEDELLIALVEEFDGKSWKKISSFIKNRSPIQCLHRWTKILKPGLVKGPWTSEEDHILINWVKTHGQTEFHTCNNVIPGRTSKQCRERWFNVLNPKVLKGDWTLNEDYLVFKLFTAYGGKWVKFVPFFNGLRAENSIKNRFYSTIRRFNTTLKKKKETESLEEKDKISLIYKSLQEQIVQENKLTSIENLVEFEYKELGWVDNLEEKDPKTKYINKEELLTLANQIKNCKDKFFRSKRKQKSSGCMVIDEQSNKVNKEEINQKQKQSSNNNNNNNNINSNINNDLFDNQMNSSQGNGPFNNDIYIDLYNKFLNNSSNNFSNSISNGSLDSNGFFNDREWTTDNIIAANKDDNIGFFDEFNFNQLQYKNKMPTSEDNYYINNNMTTSTFMNIENNNNFNNMLNYNGNKNFNNMSLDELEKNILSFCNTPNFTVQEDWSQNANKKLQNFIEDLEKPREVKDIQNNNNKINNNYSINNRKTDINNSSINNQNYINKNAANNNYQTKPELTNSKNTKNKKDSCVSEFKVPFKQDTIDGNANENRQFKIKEIKSNNKMTEYNENILTQTDTILDSKKSLSNIHGPRLDEENKEIPTNLSALVKQLNDLEELVKLTKQQINKNMQAMDYNNFNKIHENLENMNKKDNLIKNILSNHSKSDN